MCHLISQQRRKKESHKNNYFKYGQTLLYDSTELDVHCLVTGSYYTAKTQYRKFETNIPRKGTARLQSQILHSCFCERFIYSPDRSTYSAAGKQMDRTWEYIYGDRSQPYECENWAEGAQFLCWEYINPNFFAVQPNTVTDDDNLQIASFTTNVEP